MASKIPLAAPDATATPFSPLAPTLGLACLARPTFAVEYAERVAREAHAALTALGWPVAGDATLLMDVASARVAAGRLRDGAPDLLVLLSASFADASAAVAVAEALGTPVCVWAVREPGPAGDRLWLNSLCGANINAHALQRLGYVVEYLYGNPDEPDILAPLVSLARAAATRQRLRHSRVGLVGQAPTGFYGCQYDELELARTVGTTVSQLDLAAVFAAAREAARPAVEQAIATTAARSPSLRQLDGGAVQRFGQAYVTLREYARAQALDALAVRCWPEFPESFGLMPCATLGRLADDGILAACEADMHGAVTMLIALWLTGQAPLLADISAAESAHNTISLWHCGNGSACLARPGEEPTLTTHCNRRIGVAGNFAIRGGEATVLRLGVGPQGYRLLIAEGVVRGEPVNRFQGNTAVFQPDGGAQCFLDTLFHGGWEHHVVLVGGHIRRELTYLAALLGVEPVVVA